MESGMPVSHGKQGLAQKRRLSYDAFPAKTKPSLPMKLHFWLTILFSTTLVADVTPPLEQPGVPASTVPKFTIPRPAHTPKPPALNPPLAKPGAWTQAFIEAMLDNHRPTRQARWTELVYQCPVKEFGAALRAFEYIDRNGFRGAFGWEWETLWERWTEADAVDAMKAADIMNKNGNLAGLPRLVLRTWAAVDHAAAKAWFDALPAERKDDVELHQAFMAGWARNDLKGATTYMLEACPKGSRLLDGAVQRLRDEAHRAGLLPGAVAWFDSLPMNTEDGSPKIVAAGHVAWLMNYGNVEDSMRFLASLKEPALYQEKMVHDTAKKLADSQMFKRGLEWAAALPMNPKKKTFDGVPVIAEGWAEKEGKLFGAWLIEHREHAAVDFVLLGFVRYLAKQDKAEAKKWAGQIKNETAKELVAKVVEE